MLSLEEKQHYDRHLILNEIGIKGQQKLKTAKVLVIGAGGLGCPILQYLTAAGVGTIGIVDDDVVDKSNLQRQILYTYNDIGVSKAETAAKRLAGLNPFVTFEVHKTRLSKDNAIDLFQQYDIIVDGSDNFPTRYLTNDAAFLTNKPLVFGAIFKFEGQVSVFNYQNGPTYRCLYPTPPKPNEVPNCSEIGVLGVLPGIIGSLQANETIKVICDLGEVLSSKLLTYNALSMQQLVLKFPKSNIKITSLENNYDFFCGILPNNTFKEINIEEYNSNPNEFNLLDVRDLWERELKSIGGIHIPLDKLENELHIIPKDKPLIVYCKSGGRSKKAIEILQTHNFPEKLLNLTNGIG
ncbi:dinucleotide-utilizing protein [Tenacibaculum holothuriorum]|uniref:Molybdopterin-synthase adenylyltransferase n=1 Tax=Tenacibaculum holothuriorum TaxID=1635173 RepID=A0A1Y2P8U6_9FLAO|nr:molybdopterin-synthase adenylyltransferase MoeB [Tenacibaculum holothuriorum]OSY86884.1 dinucleotide-utilizing protein [Tenacibaculum holothuriorum]